MEEWLKVISTVGFPIAACCWVMWAKSRNDEKNEARADAREKDCVDRIRTIENYVRGDLCNLITQQSDVIEKCTAAIDENTRVMREIKRT